MKKCLLFFLLAVGSVLVSACDLEPKISSLPDSVGDFISERYPALLADPETEPEIYNSAVTDYGVYESPDLYGTNTTNDYVNYANASDYVLQDTGSDTKSQKQGVSIQPKTQEIVPDKEPVVDVAQEIPDDVLNIPERSVVEQPKTVTKVETKKSDKIIVKKGDTLYSLSRENGIPVKELVAINGLHEPYTLHPGQELILNPKKIVKSEPKSEPVEDLVVLERKPVQKTVPVVKASELQKVEPKKPETKSVQETKKEPEQPIVVKTSQKLKTITVAQGDTLYSVSRKYAVPVNDLAVVNGLRAPFALKQGQILRVPDVPVVAVSTVEPKTAQVKKNESNVKPVETKKSTVQNTKKSEQKKPEAKKPDVKKTETKTTNTTKTAVSKKQETKKPDVKQQSEKKKISSNPKQPLPTIAARSSSKFSWPVRGTILSHFGAKSGGLFNDGINIGAASGTSVRAAENGVVAYAGNEIKGMGNLVIIQHEGGWMTVYAHLNSMSVRRGTRVGVGDKIGSVGQTGKVTKPQLHFEVRKGTKAYNPVNYLKK